MNPSIVSEIYDFVKQENILSFYAVAYGILPNISLIKIIEKKDIPSKIHILLNSYVESHEKDRMKIKSKFPMIPIFLEYHHPNLFVQL